MRDLYGQETKLGHYQYLNNSLGQRSQTQKGACFDPLNNTYEILESGGTNIGGEDRGAVKHKVVINENKCSCGKLTIYHRPCSHMITACRIRRVDAKVHPRLATEFSLINLLSTWNPQFEPFLDKDQWPLYDGPKYVADLGLLQKSRGPRGGSGSRWTWTESPKEDQP